MKIAHFGTFDVENYGDLLFPLLLERRLGGEKVEFVHVSPVGGAPDLPDCRPAISFTAALEECESWDAILLGGGALGHGDSAGEVEKYRNPEIHTIAYPGLWLLPALIAHFRGIPLIWNAPGVPGDFSEERKRRMLQWAGWQADYLAVRDAASADVLAQSMVEAAVVPDTAIEVARLWSEAELHSENERLQKKKSWPRDRYLALHLNERYAEADLPRLGEEIRALCVSRQAAALLIAIGECHGDTAFAQRVLPHLHGHPASVFTPDSLCSVAAAIRFSDGYVGSSLHGAITACSLARPFLIVAPEARPKFAGFLAQIGAPERQISTWAKAAEAVASWPRHTQEPEEFLQVALDRHWRKISTILGTRREVSTQAGAQIVEFLSGLPPEWFPLIPMLEKSPLFAPLFKNYEEAWGSIRAQLQNSAFVAAAAYRRLDQRHQRLLADLNVLQGKLAETAADRRKLQEERQQHLNELRETKQEARRNQQEQRDALNEKLRALAASIQKRDGRIEVLQEQRGALEEKLQALRLTLEERVERITSLSESLGGERARLRQRDTQVAALEAKVGAQAASLRVVSQKLAAEVRQRAQADEQLQSALKALGKLSKWSDRLLHDFQRILRSGRWRLGCWLSLKRADDQSKEAQRLAKLVAARPRSLPNEWSTPPTISTSPRTTPAVPGKKTPLPPRAAATSPAPKQAGRGGQLVSVVIPVFNAHDDLIRCLDSVRRRTRPDHPVIALDDASTDERIWPLLQEWEKQQPNFRAVRNPQNLGYTATINRGCELAGPGDIVLLNSDTMVPPRWIEQLAACAYSRPRVATVTAVSNAAGAFSVPKNNAINSLPPGWAFEEMAEFVARMSQRLRPVVPTGNGFCLYLTSAARAAVGAFDAESFPNGYGEENDYCLRATAAGLVNLIDDATYVFHRRSASFGEAKTEILKTSRAVLDRLHPQYTRLIREWSRADPLNPVREEMQRQMEQAIADGIQSVLPNDARRSLLFVLHDGMGGTRFTSEDLSGEMARRYRAIILRAAVDSWTLYEYLESGLVPVRRYAFSESWQFDRPLTLDRLAAFTEICADYAVALAHVRHLLASGPEILSILHKRSIPIVFSFHDFYTVCPTIQLLDENQTYCAGRCTAGPGDCPLPGNWFRPPLPFLKHRYVHEHQRRMSAALALADACVTTSEASRDLITQHFPALADGRFSVIEHGRDLPKLELARSPEVGRPLRVIFFGAFNAAKGIDLVLQLLEKNRAAGNPLEFHILGQKSRGFDPEPLGAIYHGPYQRDELPERLREIGAAVSLVPSLWPETYCHVLTESWSMGLPVLASDIGTLRERVQTQGGGWLLPVGDVDRWFDKLRELPNDPANYASMLQQIRKMRFPDVAQMAHAYETIYGQLLHDGASGRAHLPDQSSTRPDVVLG